MATKTAVLFEMRVNSACRFCGRRNVIDSLMMVSSIEGVTRSIPLATRYCLSCFRKLLRAAAKTDPEVNRIVTGNAAMSRLFLGYGSHDVQPGKSTKHDDDKRLVIPNVSCPSDDMLRPYWKEISVADRNLR